jgi:hypothetical protein
LRSVACRFSEKTRQAQAQMVITHFGHDWYRPITPSNSPDLTDFIQKSSAPALISLYDHTRRGQGK